MAKIQAKSAKFEFSKYDKQVSSQPAVRSETEKINEKIRRNEKLTMQTGYKKKERRGKRTKILHTHRFR